MKKTGFVLWVVSLGAAFAAGQLDFAGIGTEDRSAKSFEEILKVRDNLERSNELNQFLLSLGADDIDAVAEVVESRQHWFNGTDLDLLMSVWAEFDGPGALAWTLSRRGPFRKRASAAAVEAVAYHNPSTARSLMASLDDPELIDALHIHMMRGWARSDFSDSLYEYSMNLQLVVERQAATEELVTAIARRGMGDLEEWLNAIPDDAPDRYKALAFMKATDLRADLDSAATAKWIEEYLSEEYAIGLPIVIARYWSARDLAATVAWLASIPTNSDRGNELMSLFSGWHKAEPEEATRWLYTVAPSESADPAVRSMVRRNVATDPGAALDWANLIHEDVHRRNVLKSISRSWYERDPEAFEAWLPESGLEIEFGSEIPFMQSNDSDDGEPSSP